MNRLMRNILMIAILTIIMAQMGLAIGVSPARQTINFEPNSEHTVSFNIINDQKKDMELFLEVTGDAEGADVYLKKQIVEVSAEEDRKEISYRVKLPESFNSPGTKELRLVIKEMPDQDSDQPIHIGTLVGVVHQLRIKVPYEGKYLNVDEMEINEAKPGKTVSFILPVNNLGTETLESVKADIEILGPTNEVISEVETQEISLGPKKRQLLKAYWKADVNPGKYYAVAKVDYDGKSDRTEKVFNVGDLGIEILDIITEDYELGEIAKINFLLKSTWNEKLSNIYAELFIKDKDGDDVATVKSASIDLEPGEDGTLTTYWDTAGLEEGKYLANMKLYSAESSIERQFEITLALTQLSTNMLGATARATGLGEPNLGKTILTAVIILLILVNISWFFFFKKRMPKGKGSIDTVIKGPERTGKENLKDLHSKINRLHNNLKKTKNYEKELDNKVARYKKMYKSGEITYGEYEYLLNQALKGKSIDEWRRYYRNYNAETKDTIARLKKEAEKANKK